MILHKKTCATCWKPVKFAKRDCTEAYALKVSEEFSVFT